MAERSDRLCACGCGESLRSVKPSDRFVGNHRERGRSRERQPCRVCGAPKGRRRGSKLCLACAPIVAAEKERATGRRKLARKRAVKPTVQPPLPGVAKRCARCERVLALDAFPSRSGKAASYCTPCQAEHFHQLAIAKYGLTPKSYAALLRTQHGRCAICLRRDVGRRLAVDHDHETGAVRGLLCSRCNRYLIGTSGDDADVLRRAAAYLDSPTAAGGRTSEYPEYAALQVEQWMVELRENDPAASLHMLVLGHDDQPPEDALCFIPRDEFVARFGEERLAELS